MIISVKRLRYFGSTRNDIAVFSTQYRKALRNLADLKNQLIEANCRLTRANLFEDYEEQAREIEGVKEDAYRYGVNLSDRRDSLGFNRIEMRLELACFRYKRSRSRNFDVHASRELSVLIKLRREFSGAE